MPSAAAGTTAMLSLLPRLARAAAGLAAAALVLAGPPYALVRFTGWPLPRHVPTWPQLKAFLATPLSDSAIITGLALAVWLVWALAVISLFIEAAATIAGRRAPRLPAIGPFQAAAAIVTGAIVATLPQATGASPPAAPLRAALTVSTEAAPPAAPAHSGAAPPAAAPAPTARAGAGGDGAPARWPLVHRVAEGDSLWAIAARYLGDGERWHELYRLNAGKPQPDGGALTDPDLIYPGWVLLMPPQPARPGSAASPAPHDRQPPATHPPVGPAHGGGHHGGGRREGSRAPSPAATGAHQRSRPVAVRLPSGALIGISVALMVAAALALARIQRRRRYRPRIGSPGGIGPGEPALPAVIAVLRRAARPAPPDTGADDDDSRGEDAPAVTDPYLELYDGASPRPGRDGEAAPADQAREPGPSGPAAVPAVRPPGTIPLGVHGAGEAALDITALGGLGLTGPGAHAAARALLATLLAQAPRAPGVPAPAVIIPAPDAARLLPGEDTASIPGVSAPATLDMALGEMEAALLHRARTAGVGDGDDPLAAAAAAGDPGPGATLIATCGPAAAGRLRGILESGRHLHAAAVLLGPWQPGVTCEVAADGVITAVTPPTAALEGIHMFHLGAADTAAITAVLREARGTPVAADDPPPAPGAGLPACRTPPGPPGVRPAPDGHLPPATAAPPPPGPARDEDPVPEPARPAPAIAAPSAGPGPAGNGQTAPPAAAHTVQLAMLGPLRITAAGKEIGGGLRKARELLAFLAVHPDGASGEAISEALWPEADPDHATAQRNLALRKARDMLRTATGLTAPMWIINASGRYRLDPALITTDLWQFTTTLDQARHAPGDSARLAACRQAAGLYRGELAEGEGYDWAEPHAEAARRRALDAWTAIAEILQPDDPGQALAALETALGHDPYNESLYQRIMRLQAAAGRPEAVRRTLRLLETRLTELGVTPGPQTRQVAASLLGTPAPAPQQQQRTPAPAPGSQAREQRSSR